MVNGMDGAIPNGHMDVYDGPREVMSPSQPGVPQGGEDELFRARTMTMAQGPGFQMRQMADVVMDEPTMNA